MRQKQIEKFRVYGCGRCGATAAASAAQAASLNSGSEKKRGETHIEDVRGSAMIQ
jgi:hypothetical protein